MPESSPIIFTRTDYSLSQHIINIVHELADHFKVRRSYIPQFCSMIRGSKRWNMSNLNSQLGFWEQRMSGIEGTRTIIDIVKRAFLGCQSNEDIKHLRGAMVEALIIGVHGGTATLNDNRYGWGALVTLVLSSGPKEIKYRCHEFQHGIECCNRSTVDYGYWDGHHGKFYECKAQPAAIGCKEIKYMQELKTQLEANSISHEVFFVCPESREAIEMKLDTYDLGPLYKPFGAEDIQSTMPA